MYVLDSEIRKKFDEILSFRFDAGELYRYSDRDDIREDYLVMWNLITCKIDTFLQDMDSILYPEKEE